MVEKTFESRGVRDNWYSESVHSQPTTTILLVATIVIGLFLWGLSEILALPWEQTRIALYLVGAPLLVFWAFTIHKVLGEALLIIAYAGAGFLFAQASQSPGFLALLVIPVGLAMTLYGKIAGIISAFAAVLIFLYQASPWQSPFTLAFCQLVLLLVATLCIVWGISRVAEDLARWAQERYEQMRTQLEEALNQRVELKQTRDDLIHANMELERLADRLTVMTRIAEEANHVADLGPLIEAWKFDLNDIPKALLEEYSLKGVLYGLPVFGHTVYMIAYNKDIFDKAGVAYPPRYWTWDDFLETAKKVTMDENRDGEPEIWGTDLDIINPARLLPYLWSWGADFYNYPELNKCTLNSPQAVEAIQWALDLIRVHKVAPPPEMGAADLGITFPGGKVAMSWVGSGSWVDPKDPTKFAWGFKWGLTDPPKKVETRSLIHSTGMSIARTSKYRDAAWQFLQFLMSPESQIFYSQRAGKISALISVGAKYAFANLPPEDLQVVNDVIGYAWSRVHWRTPIWHKSASGTQVPEMQKAWLGQQTVKEALDRTCAEVDKMFAELQKQ